MHDLEPHHQWRGYYIAAEDQRSPFYRRQYSEFYYSQKVYNYFIHPQWDCFGSQTLYVKILYADYDMGYAILEFIGEWNDCLYNDIGVLKRELIDLMIEKGINRYILICEHVFNFHGDDDCYYEEWWDDVKEENGWISMINTGAHLQDELADAGVHRYVEYGINMQNVTWRNQRPETLYEDVERRLKHTTRLLD